MPPQADPDPGDLRPFRRQLDQAARGCERARADIHRRFAGSLRRFVSRIVGPGFLRHSTVDEVCQETLLRVFTQLPDLPERVTPTEFRNRLFRNARWIVVRMAEQGRDFVGESAVRRAEGEVPEDREELPSSTGSVTRQDEMARLERLISSLRPAYADVIRLRTEGLTFAEVAVQLGCKQDAARQRYARAVEELRNLLRDRGEDVP